MPKPKPNHSKQITESIPEYFFIYDVNKEAITYLSDSFEKFRIDNPTGTDLEQMRTMIHDSFYDVFEALSKGIYVQDKDMKIKTSERGENWVNIKTYPIISDGNQLISGHVLDVTSKRNQLQGLKKESDELEQIIHIMAHDLRGPLGSILNISDIQKTAMQEKDFNNAELYAAMIDRIAKEMETTLQGMIEMIKLKSDRFELKKSKINIKDFILNLVDNYKMDMITRGIGFHTDLPDQELYVDLDPLKFRLVIQNLISNAIKFTEKGGNITISLYKKNNDIKIEIKDSGIGIPENKYAYIFEQFSKAKRTGVRGEKSTGLGLSIARKITQIHQGNIEVKSKVGEGSSFIVSLPL